MFDAKNPRRRLIQKGSVSFNKHVMRRRLPVANRRASDKIGNREILRRLSGSFTAPKLKLVYAASQRFCFAPVISLNDLNDLRIIEARSLNVAGLEHAVRKPESNFSIEHS